jgi:hypothetical protein
LGWDGVGNLQRQSGGWNNQQNNFVVWDWRNLTINQKIKIYLNQCFPIIHIFFNLLLSIRQLIPYKLIQWNMKIKIIIYNNYLIYYLYNFMNWFIHNSFSIVLKIWIDD